MSVMSKPVMKVELRETEYGSPQPVVIVEFVEQMHWRVGEAFLHCLAAALSMRSLSEQWIVQLGGISSQGKGRPQRAVVKIELADGTDREAERCITMLEQAVASLRKDTMISTLFQGE